jgi:hypothetical protein
MSEANLHGIGAPTLMQRTGYYSTAPISDLFRREQLQREALSQAVQRLIGQYQTFPEGGEPNGRVCVDFVQPVTIQTEDGRILSHVTRELSNTGVRLLGAYPLLGKVVRIHIAQPESGEQFDFIVRILWTFAVANALFENGGQFLEVEASCKCDEETHMALHTRRRRPDNGHSAGHAGPRAQRLTSDLDAG